MWLYCLGYLKSNHNWYLYGYEKITAKYLLLTLNMTSHNTNWVAVSCHISFGRASSRVGIAVTLSYLLQRCVLTIWHRRQLSYLLRRPCVLSSWHRRYVVISPLAAAMMSPVRTTSYHITTQNDVVVLVMLVRWFSARGTMSQAMWGHVR